MGVGASGKLKSKYEEMMLALYLFVTEHTNTRNIAHHTLRLALTCVLTETQGCNFDNLESYQTLA